MLSLRLCKKRHGIPGNDGRCQGGKADDVTKRHIAYEALPFPSSGPEIGWDCVKTLSLPPTASLHPISTFLALISNSRLALWAV